MYAVVGQVKVDSAREDEARKLLEELTVPAAKGLAGFNNGCWARALDGEEGHSLLLFDTEANREPRRNGSPRVPPPGAPVTFTSVSVCEVVAQA